MDGGKIIKFRFIHMRFIVGTSKTSKLLILKTNIVARCSNSDVGRALKTLGNADLVILA